MAKKNNAHTFDFTGILNAEINQQDWKEKKKLLEEQFGKFKMALDTDLAEAEAQKILDMFNEKLNIQLNVEQVKKDAEAVKKIIETALASINNIDTSALRGIEDTLEGIATTTEKIFNKIDGNAQNAFNNIEQGAKKASKSAIKSVSQVEAALRRVGKGTDAFKDIQNTVRGKFEIKDTKNKTYTEQEARQVVLNLEQQRKSVRENPNATWEQKYATDVKFVDAYKGYKVKFGQLSDEIEGIYKSLINTYYDQKNMLQNIVNVGKSTKKHPQPLVGYDGGEPWARESTLKEVRDILQGGIKVSGDGGGSKSSPKNNSSPKLPKTLDEYTVYRGIFPSDEEDVRTREDIIKESGGAEYWAKDKNFARSYTDGQENGSAILVGKVTPKKPLIIDANYQTFDMFEEMPDLFAKLPDLQKLIEKNKKDGTFNADEVQSYIHMQAKEMGYDTIVFENIRDAMFPEAKEFGGRVTTDIAILDDSVLKVVGVFNEASEQMDDLGRKQFSDEISSELPKYYKPPQTSAETLVEPTIEPKAVEQEIQENTGSKPIEVPVKPVVSEDLDKKKTRLATINRALTDINPSDKVRANKDAAEYWYQQKHMGNGSAYEGLIK